MLKKIIVSIRTNPDDDSKIKEDLQILTKHDVFKIPIEATILPEDKFKEVDEENQKLGKRTLNSRVRNRLNTSIRDGQQLMSENRDEVDPMNEGDED